MARFGQAIEAARPAKLRLINVFATLPKIISICLPKRAFRLHGRITGRLLSGPVLDACLLAPAGSFQMLCNNKSQPANKKVYPTHTCRPSCKAKMLFKDGTDNWPEDTFPAKQPVCGNIAGFWELKNYNPVSFRPYWVRTVARTSSADALFQAPISRQSTGIPSASGQCRSGTPAPAEQTGRTPRPAIDTGTETA